MSSKKKKNDYDQIGSDDNSVNSEAIPSPFQEFSKNTFRQIEKSLQGMEKIIDELENL